MKITLAGPAWPYRGGIAEFSNRLAREFIAEGHDADIVTFTLQYPGFLFPGKTQFNDSPAPEGIRIRRLINSVNPLNWIITGRKLKREKPDLLILRFWLPFMGPALGTIARIVRSNHHTKIICIFDNVIPHEKRPGDKQLTRYFTGSIDGAIVLARAVGEDLKKFRSDVPVKFNPHPLFDNYGEKQSGEKALQILNLSAGYRYLLFFGFIREYKGLDLLIEAFADPVLRNKNLKLLVAGEFYEDSSPYTDLIGKLKLEKEIILFNRFIRDDEVSAFFSAASLIVQPYRSATQSGVTQIAFHFEKPMLVTDVGGLKEIVPDRRCGYVVQPNPSSIAEAIKDYFDNDREEDFTACVREEKKKFSWDKMTKVILECYSEIR
ncbi:MAG: glycosyltransferase [Chloroflexota bacterium]